MKLRTRGVSQALQRDTQEARAQEAVQQLQQVLAMGGWMLRYVRACGVWVEDLKGLLLDAIDIRDQNG